MQFAMETVVAAAVIDQAECLIDISFAHIDACFYNGRAHLDFVNYMLNTVRPWQCRAGPITAWWRSMI